MSVRLVIVFLVIPIFMLAAWKFFALPIWGADALQPFFVGFLAAGVLDIVIAFICWFPGRC